jgi:ROK family
VGAKLEARLFGAIEAGGTKINMAVGTGPENVVASPRVQTTTPEVTIAAILAFFEPFACRIASFGIASFGPVRIDRAAPDWGCLLATPKLGWSGKSFSHPLIERFGVPVNLDTDVNAAALAERRFGSLSGLNSAAYMTVSAAQRVTATPPARRRSPDAYIRSAPSVTKDARVANAVSHAGAILGRPGQTRHSFRFLWSNLSLGTGGVSLTVTVSRPDRSTSGSSFL